MTRHDSNARSLDLARRIDGLCLPFEKAWRAGDSPRLEDYLTELPEADRPVLFAELLRLEAEFRYDRGEHAPPADLYARFPAERPQIDAVWAELAGQSPGPTAGPKQLGEFRIVREIGRGGMGVVYEADQVSLNRRVALKVLPRQMQLPATAKRRFEREARAAASLHHTNIVPVFGVGEHDGMPYYAMQFINGSSLDRVLRELKRLTHQPELAAGSTSSVAAAATLLDGPPPAPTAGPAPTAAPRAGAGGPDRDYWVRVAGLGVQVAEALEYAHQHGIVHRDVKPANLLLDRDGTVWVTDFGLAKSDEQENLTRSGDILGTVRYLPPEALDGRYDRRSDVYALGLTLYELLAFQPAFGDSDRGRLLNRVATADAPHLSTRNPHLPRDLTTIVHKCIDRDAAARYQTAGELSTDLQRFLADQPILARRPTTAERLRRWARHHRSLAASLAVIAALVGTTAVGSTVAAFWYQESARRNARLAADEEDARQQAELAGKGERWERYRANIATAASALQTHNTEIAESSLAAAPAVHRNWEWRHFHSQLDSSRLALEAPFELNHVVMSADGQRLAAAEGSQDGGTGPRVVVWDVTSGRRIQLPSDAGNTTSQTLSSDCRLAAFGTNDGTVRLFDLTTGRESANLKMHTGKVTALAFSPDGRSLYSGGEDRTIRRLDTTTTRHTDVLRDLDQAIAHLVPSPDGKRLFVGTTTVRLWDLERRQVIAESGAEAPRLWPLCFSPDGGRAAFGGTYPNNHVQVLDARTGKRLTELRGHQNSIFHVTFSPDGSRIASASQDQTVRLWDSRSGAQLAVLFGHTSSVYAVPFSPDGKRLASVADEGAVCLWDAVDGKLIEILRGHSKSVGGAVWSPDGRQLATASTDRTLRLWDVPSSAGRGVLAGHTNFVYDVACSSDGTQLASAGWDGTVRLFDRDRGVETATLKHDDSVVTGVSIAPNGQLLASVTRNNRIILWDLVGGKPRYTFVAASGTNDARAVFHPHGTLLAFGTSDGLIRLWDVATGHSVGDFSAGSPVVCDVVFSPDGQYLACAGRDGTISIWDFERRIRVKVLPGHTDQVNRLTYSRDGAHLASAGHDRTARFWDVETGRELRPPMVHTSVVWCVALSPDGTRLATASADNTIRLWDLATGQEVAELRGHRTYVKSIVFHPDGTQLFSASGDFTVRVWDSFSARMRAQSRKGAGKD